MDASELNFTIPKEIILHIVSFMDDRTKRQMRLANTAWFELINYSNFTFYFTRLERLPEIVDRLSTYTQLIGIKFVKSRIPKMQEWIVHLPKLTNVTSLSIQTSDYSGCSLDEWMALTTLSNLQNWSATYSCPSGLVAKLHSLTELIVQENYSWTLFSEALPKYTNLQSLSFSHNSAVEDLDLSSLSHKLTRLEISAVISGRGISKLTNLKELAYYQHDYATQEPFPFSQLSRLESLTLNQNLLDTARLPRNITQLVISGKNITPDFQAELAHLDRLKSIGIDLVAPDSTHSYLTAMTALEDINLWPSASLEFDQPWQHASGACLSYLRSDKLTSLTLGATPYMTNLEHLSSLTSIVDIFIFEEDASQADIDYSGVSSMTNLTSLAIYASARRPSLLCLTDLVSLKVLSIEASQGNDMALDDRLILTQLTNLTQLSLNGCSRATVANLAFCTNLRSIRLPLIFPNVDYGYLTTMKNLTELSAVHAVGDNESFWNILPQVTSLKSLELRGLTSDEEIITLTSLQHLTHLSIRQSPQFKGEHVTALTTVHQLILDIGNSSVHLKEEDLFKKMPFLCFVAL